MPFSLVHFASLIFNRQIGWFRYILSCKKINDIFKILGVLGRLTVLTVIYHPRNMTVMPAIRMSTLPQIKFNDGSEKPEPKIDPVIEASQE